MIDAFIKLGIHAAVAILLTVAAVAWIEPDGIGGVFIIFLFCAALSLVVGTGVAALRRRP